MEELSRLVYLVVVLQEHTVTRRVWLLSIFLDAADEPLHQNRCAVFETRLAKRACQLDFRRYDNGIFVKADHGDVELFLADGQLARRIRRHRRGVFDAESIPKFSVSALNAPAGKQQRRRQPAALDLMYFLFQRLPELSKYTI